MLVGGVPLFSSRNQKNMHSRLIGGFKVPLGVSGCVNDVCVLCGVLTCPRRTSASPPVAAGMNTSKINEWTD